MNPWVEFGLGGVLAYAAFAAYKKVSAPALRIPPDRARAGALAITQASAFGCNRIARETVQAFQVAMNPWLSGTFPLLRTDGVLDTDTAQWVDDVNTFYNGMHNLFSCTGVTT